MITGKYTGLIEIDFHIDADKPGMLPFAELQKSVTGELSGMIRDMVGEELADMADVTVTTQQAWLEEQGKGAGGKEAADGIHKTGQ